MKILVAHAPAGSGHQRAAEAVFSSIRSMEPSAEATLVNAGQYSDPVYRWALVRGYLLLIQKAPFLWGMGYYLSDLKPFNRLSQQLHRVSNGLHGKPLEALFIESRADCILCTHFFPMEVAANLKARGRISARIITVITDYLPHALWIAPGVDLYVVASPQAEESLISRGIPGDRILVLGIPADTKFAQPADRALLAKRFGLEPERLTILIGSGGAGTGPVEKLVRLLGKARGPLQLLVVAGKNEALVRKMETLRAGFPHPMKVFGFVDFMYELMGASDLLITKPGGLTCAEALIKGLPMILIHPIPGQENRNAAVLRGMGAALVARRLEEVPARIQELLENPQRLQYLGRRAREVGRPEAADRIARLAIQ